MRSNKISQGTKRTRKQQKQIIPRSMGIPPRVQFTFVYADMIAVSAGAAYGQYTFRGNSLFDPDYTGTGHQPRYFDQYSAMYSKYKVLSSSINVSASNYSTSSSVIMTVTPHSEVLTLTSYPAAAEQPLTKRTQQIPISTRQGARNSVRASASTQTILGLNNAQLQSEDYSALTGANPISVWYWNIGLFNPQGANVSVTLDLEIRYVAVLYDRVDPGSS